MEKRHIVFICSEIAVNGGITETFIHYNNDVWGLRCAVIDIVGCKFFLGGIFIIAGRTSGSEVSKLHQECDVCAILVLHRVRGEEFVVEAVLMFNDIIIVKRSGKCPYK